jgi:hypothetical protein
MPGVTEPGPDVPQPAVPYPGVPHPGVPDDAVRTPATVTAAVVLTILTAVCGCGGVLLGAVFLALLSSALLPSFSPEDARFLVLWGVGVVGVAVALAGVTIVAAVQLLQRRRWAWWTLVVLCPVAALLSVQGASLLLPLGVTAGAVAAFVLLLLPATRAWSTATPERSVDPAAGHSADPAARCGARP